MKDTAVANDYKLFNENRFGIAHNLLWVKIHSRVRLQIEQQFPSMGGKKNYH